MDKSAHLIDKLRAERKFFHLFDEKEITLLKSLFEVVELPAGTLLAREGGKSDGHFEIVASGLIEVKKATEFGKSLVLAKLGSGTILGQIGLDENPWPVPITMVTLQDTTLLRLSHEEGRLLLAEQPRMAIKFLLEIIRVTQIRARELAARFSSIF